MKHLVVQIAGAAGVAGVVLLLAVLPAEYGYDPTGVGEVLGLTGLAEVPPRVLSLRSEVLRRDEVSFELAPFESVEYKYCLDQGAAMTFAWRATGDVAYDMHAEPDGAPEGFAESFGAGASGGRAGSYVAPFTGIHGWYWENRQQQRVTVTLGSVGFYTETTTFRDGFQTTSVPPRNTPQPATMQ
jgi:hypothetical protein